MAIEIVAPGLGCTVQDQGRLGHYDVGIPPSGALDLFSALAANLLVGNDEGAGVLEAAYLGPQLRFRAPAVVAVTGARSRISSRLVSKAWTTASITIRKLGMPRPSSGGK